MKKHVLQFIFLLLSTTLMAQSNKVSVVNGADGSRLMVDGKELIVNGMNWDYVPIGTTIASTSYQFWNQPDPIIKAALDAEMALLKNMGVNTIRQYVGVPPKWVEYIYKEYGIYTMINHAFGRYGLTLNGAWTPNTEYDDPTTKALLMKEVREATKPVGGMMRGSVPFDATTLQESLAVYASAADVFGNLVPDGSQGGEAAPAIWEDPDGFAAALETWQQAVSAAIEADPQDIDAARPVVGKVLNSCKGCHDSYRIEDD